MSTDNYKQLAAQLRKPQGAMGDEVAEFMNAGNELLNRNTIQQIKLTGDLSIIEIGMGNGKFIPELFEMFSISSYHGCDYSMDMVQSATRLNEGNPEKHKVHFYHCEAKQLPFVSQTQDVIFTVNTIYFWDDVDQVLQEFGRVLVNNGQLIIGLRPKHLMQHYPFVQRGFQLFSAKEVENALLKNGFTTVEVSSYREPDFTNGGVTFPVESLVVSAYKK